MAHGEESFIADKTYLLSFLLLLFRFSLENGGHARSRRGCRWSRSCRRDRGGSRFSLFRCIFQLFFFLLSLLGGSGRRPGPSNGQRNDTADRLFGLFIALASLGTLTGIVGIFLLLVDHGRQRGLRDSIDIDHIQLVQAQGFVKEVFVVRLLVVGIIVAVHVIIQIFPDRIDTVHIQDVVVDQTHNALQFGNMMLVLHNVHVELINGLFVGLFALARGQLFNLNFGFIDQRLQTLHCLSDPFGRIRFRLFARIQSFFPCQTFLAVGFRLGFLFANLELLHFGFNEPSCL